MLAAHMPNQNLSIQLYLEALNTTTTTFSHLSAAQQSQVKHQGRWGPFLPWCHLFVLQRFKRWHVSVYTCGSTFEREAEPLSPYWRRIEAFVDRYGVWMHIQGIFFFFFFWEPVCWIMTEWERSHRDKGEGRRREGERARRGNRWRGRKEGRIWIDVISVCLWWLPQRVSRVMVKYNGRL